MIVVPAVRGVIVPAKAAEGATDRPRVAVVRDGPLVEAVVPAPNPAGPSEAAPVLWGVAANLVNEESHLRLCPKSTSR